MARRPDIRAAEVAVLRNWISWLKIADQRLRGPYDHMLREHLNDRQRIKARDSEK